MVSSLAKPAARHKSGEETQYQFKRMAHDGCPMLTSCEQLVAATNKESLICTTARAPGAWHLPGRQARTAHGAPRRGVVRSRARPSLLRQAGSADTAAVPVRLL